jgi:putative photosynthetic complex assembly protein
MSSPAHPNFPRSNFPREAFWGGAALVAFVLAGAALVRLDVLPAVADPAAARAAADVTALETHAIVFRDAPGGAVLVSTSDGRTLTAVAANSPDGFIRGVLRGLARERQMHGIGPEAPFRLIRWSDGTMSLADPSTGRTIELWAFGPTNRASFEALLAKVRGRVAA